MAEFMAAVLDHSNARPAGVSIQATPSDGWGDVAATVMVSVRDDSFGAVENQPVDVFSSTSANNGLRKDGTCNFSSDPDDVNFGDLIEGDCTWNDNDDATDVDGNVLLESDVLQGSTRIIYAWIGEEDGDVFDADSADEGPEQIGQELFVAQVLARHLETACRDVPVRSNFAFLFLGSELSKGIAGVPLDVDHGGAGPVAPFTLFPDGRSATEGSKCSDPTGSP